MLSKENKQSVLHCIHQIFGKNLTRLLALSLFPLNTLADISSNELPQGADIVSGDITINSHDNVMNIDQDSQQGIIDWQTFNVGSDATVNFNQPNSSASTLNRVVTDNASQIYGNINANGQVLLVNSSGVYISENGRVETGGIVATTQEINNQEYLDNPDRIILRESDQSGSIENHGTVIANEAYVAMLAPEVRNEGLITANMGEVVLASGREIILSFNDGQITDVITTPSLLNSLIENKLAIEAAGGKVILSATAMNQINGGLINQAGSINVGSTEKVAVNEGGRIYLTSNEVVFDGGSQTLANADTQGGEIEVAANDITIEEDARIEASATLNGDGGSIELVAENEVTINGVIKADGADEGVGGEVLTQGEQVILEDNAQISAKSGENAPIIQENNIKILENDEIVAQNSNQGNWRIVSAASVWTQTHASVIELALLNANVSETVNADLCVTNCSSDQVGDLVIGDDITLNNRSTTLTQLELTASDYLSLQGTISDEHQNLILEATGFGGLSLGTVADITANQVSFRSAEQLDVLGSVTATGNEKTNPLANFIGANMVMAGLIQTSNQTRLGHIVMTALNQINLRPESKVLANGDAGGTVLINARHLDVDGFIQSNGGTGRGGTITLDIEETVDMNQAWIESNGFDAGGTIKIQVRDGPLNMEATRIQTNASNGRGGTILISGREYTRISSSHIETKGTSQGGEIYLGYDQDNQRIPFSKYLFISKNTIVDARNFNNTNGGFVETSGHVVNILATINVGRGGMWLIDPFDVTISTTTSGDTYSANFDPTQTTVLNYASIEASLNSGTDVSITTGSATANTLTVDMAIQPKCNQPSCSGATLSLTGGTIDINRDITSDGIDLNLVLTGATIDIDNSISLNGGTLTINTINNSSGGDIDSGSTISAASIEKNGAGSFTISSTSTMTGTSTINAGTLIATANAFGDEDVVVNTGGTFEIRGFDYSSKGTIFLNGGTLSGTSTMPSITNDGAVDLQANSILDVASGTTLTLDAVVSGGYGVTKSGAGTLVMSANNTFTHGLNVDAGMVSVTAIQFGLVNNSNFDLVIADGATFSAGGYDLFGDNQAQIVSTVEIQSGGTMTNGGNFFNKLGNLTLSGGTLTSTGGFTSNDLSDSVAWTLSETVTATADSTISGSAEIFNGHDGNGVIFSVSDGSTLTVSAPLIDGDDSTWSGTGLSTGISKTGLGTLTLSGTNTFSGTVAISAGTLAISNASALGATSAGTTVASGAMLQVSGDINIAEPITINGTGISGNGAIYFLSGNNTYSGAITLGANSTITSAAGNQEFSGSINGAYDLTITAAANWTQSAAIGGSSALADYSLTATSGNVSTNSITANGSVSIFGIDVSQTNGSSITAGSNEDIIISATGDYRIAAFSASNSLITSGTGRWIVYAADDEKSIFGDSTNSWLNSNNTPLWGATYSTLSPSSVPSGNRYVFAETNDQTIIFTTLDETITYGDSLDLSDNYALTTSGLSGLSNVYDAVSSGSISLATVYSSNPTISIVATGATTSSSGNTEVGSYTITLSLSGGSTNTGYSIASPYNRGTLTVSAKTLTATADAANKTYDGTTTATVTLTLSGVVGSDSVSSTNGATFSQSDVGTGLTATVNSITLTGDDAGNYTISSGQTDTADITQKALTISGITASNKTYDGDNTATIDYSSAAFAGLVSGDSVTVTATGTFSDENVGTDKTVTLSETTGGADEGNYSITTQGTTTANITQKALTYTVDASDKTYDGTDAATVTITLAGLVGAETLTTTETSTFAQTTVGTGITVTVDSISLVDGTGDADNYSISSGQTDTAAITAKTLTATADAANKTYDGTTTATVTLTLSGVVGSDSVSSTNGATFSQSDVGTGLTATVNSITLTGDDAGNYTISSGQTDTADITQKALTISGITASNKTYDGNNTATIDYSSAAFAGLVSGDSVTVTATGTFSNENVGTDKTVTLSETTGGADEGNYSITTQGTTTANITQKALTYTVDASDKTYDGTDAATVTITLAGLVGAETLTTTETSTFAQTTVGTGITVTVDSISLVDGTGDADNYSISSGQTDTAAITAKTLTATADAANKTYDGTTTATVTLTLSGVVGSDSVSSTNGATFSQSDVGTGLTATVNSITLTGDDAGNYTISSGQTDTADITQKALGYTVDASNKTYDGTDAATITITLSGLVGAETLTATGIATFDSANVGTRTATVNTITLTDGTGDADNYSISTGGTDSASITQKALTYTVDASDKTYDGTDAATVTITLAGLVGAETLTTTETSTFAQTTVGTGITVTVDSISLVDGTGDADNYSISSGQTDTADITQKALTISGITASNKTYDGDNTATIDYSSAAFAGLVSGDSVTVTATGTFSDENVGTDKTVTLSETTGGADEGNYSITTQGTTTANITQKALTYTVDASNKTYDGTDAATVTITLSGLVGAETLTTTETSTFAQTTVGTGITVTVDSISLVDGTGDADNYSISSGQTDTADITQKALTISGITASNKTYDGNNTATIDYSSAAFAGLVSGDSVTVTATGTFSNENVGTDKTVTLSETTGGADEGNYSITTQGTTTANITQKALTYTVDASDKTYDGTDAATVTITLAGLVGAETLTTTETSTFAQTTVGTGITVTVDSISLVDGTGDADNYSISSGQTDTAAITAKTLTATADAANKTYDGTTTATVTLTLSGVVGSDSVSSTNGATFSQSDVGTGLTATVNSITLTGDDAGNYTISSGQTDTAAITAKALTYTVDASDKTYDGTDAATITITLSGLVGAETLTTTETSTFAQTTVGTGITVTVDSISLVDGTGDADNYSISSGQTDTAAITAKTLTATADAANKTYDGTTTATVTLTLSGVVGSDSVSSTNGATFSQSDVGTGLTATVNSITLTGDDAGNYTISSGQTDTADITQKALGYTVDASNKTYDGTDAATITITLSGLVGAETLTATGIATFDSANVGTRTATVNTITLTDGTGDADNYSISTGGTDSASITQKALTYTVDASDKTYDGTNSATATLSLTGLVGSETLDVTNTASFTNANAGDDKTVTVTSVNLADGTNGGLAANYSISSGETTTATINKATLNVAPLDDAKFVGEADPVGFNGVIYNGFISGESSSDLGGSTTISRNAGETAGDYTLSLTQALTSDNYTINYGTGTFTIAATTAILVDLVQNNTLYYGSDPTYGSGQSHTISARDIDGALTVTVSGQEATITKSGTTVAVAPLVPNAATASTAGYYEVGGYNYSVDTVDANYSLADGYSIIVDSGEYNITPLEIDVNATVTVGGLTKTYDGNANISGLTTTISSSPVKTGDDVTFAATGTFDSRHVGTSKTVSISMAISGDDANNYSLSNNSISSNTGTITQLNSVTWLGSAGDGLWATASNWANGAIPDQSNVATVIIPDGSTVNYQYDVLGQIGSAITNNGDLTLSGTTDFTFSNDVAGDGTIIFDADQVGDTLTLSGTSTMTGTVNIQEHTAIIAASNALGTGTLRANDGYFSVSSGVTLNQLTTAGQINLTSDLNTSGNIIFGGNLVIAGGNGTDANNLDPLEINSNNNDITFNGTVTAGSASKANFRSLTIDAGTGEVNINDRFGYAFNGVTYSNLTSTNLWQLNVTAAAINLRADVMTFERQTYNGAMFVGDNGTNGLTRTLLSVDPEVIINGTVDDLDPNTSHTLVTKAVSLNTDTPVVNVTGEIGATNPLVNWIAETGRQNTAEEWGNITTGTSGTLTYQGDTISGGAQTLAASEQSGYVAPANTSTDSTAQNAGSIAGRFKQAYRNIVTNTTEKFREIRQKTMIGIGVKILDDKRDCDASGANDCKSTITIRGMLDQLIRKLWIRFA